MNKLLIFLLEEFASAAETVTEYAIAKTVCAPVCIKRL
jgi:hypothetical protein